MRVVDAPSQSPDKPAGTLHVRIVKDSGGDYGRFDIPEGVDKRFWAWDGSQIVEASQAVQDAITGPEEAAAQAEHDAGAPSGNLASWSKREKCLLLITYKLAKLHWPNMTRPQFLTQVKTEWDSLK